MRVKRLFSMLMCVAVIALAAGCEMKGGQVGQRAATAGVDFWRIRPVKMRVYPSTRFVQYENQLALEARVEFVDELRDPMKAVGRLRFEVYASNRDGEVIDQKRLFAWDVPMLTIEANREYYDAVTRAYLFRLGLESLPADVDRTIVRVTFMPPVGERLEATAVVMVQ